MRERIRKKGIVSAIFLATCLMFSQGCAGKQSVVGTWICQNSESQGEIMALYEDGTCLNAPVNGAKSYVIQGDKIIFTTPQGNSVAYSLAKSESEALEFEDKYYLSEDTMVLGRDRYKRVLNRVIEN